MKTSGLTELLVRCVLVVATILPGPASATQTDIVGPAGSSDFGTLVSVLPNGNIVVTSDQAVYLYDTNGSMISSLSTSGGGTASILVVGDSNFVAISPYWDNGPVTSAGAVTWIDGSVGLSGVVSSANSLVGSQPYDKVGSGGVTVLANGNYVVSSPWWNGYQGAVTWANGDVGISGQVTPDNSLTGLASGVQTEQFDIVPLTGGNYVVANPRWNDDSGMASWRSGITALAGVITSENSLTGATGDHVGGGGVTALSNGNYVVSSPAWNQYLGAATWGDGASGASGQISVLNSLVGSGGIDQVSLGGIIVLSNGNYVVSSPYWNGIRGAATWGYGQGGTVGEISAANSLVGTTAFEGLGFLFALRNGNYVVTDPDWNTYVGSITWGDGTGGTVGEISENNSVFGPPGGDLVGNGGVTALSNGNFVVGSYYWNQNAGATTWMSGAHATTGTISAANSLVGTGVVEYVGLPGHVVPLSNGNYVIEDERWNDQRGAVTWAQGAATTSGIISSANSIVGSQTGDRIGTITALSNGNYVISSNLWNSGSGAVRLGNGLAGTTGTMSATNSLIGSANDQVGYQVFAFADGNYAILSPSWNEGRGAVTLASGAFSLIGTIQPWNSVRALTPDYGTALTLAYDANRHQLVVGRRGDNIVSLFTMDQVFADRFD